MNPPAALQSVLDPYGPHAEAVATLAWVLFGGGAIVFVVVAGFTAYALYSPERRRRSIASGRFVIYAGIAFPGIVLTALFVYSLTLARDVVPAGAADLRVEVIGHQWWWRVRYLDASGGVDFVTANELRLPAGRSVELILSSADVIHSFWVPALAGKLDMIPGSVKRLRVDAARTGLFRGQCAEYCGGPHALMALYVVALDEDEFERWRAAQRRSAREPQSDRERRGRTLFLEHCAACHAVRGTPAEGVLGPDLTHVASRHSLAAGALPNGAEAIARWIRDSQRVKPGNLMPSLDIFTDEDLSALAAYVAALD
ncbi:MAG TPA: cytochrome c oxidase subunit II [Burkholderiales bacterium]|nr:cytochrome c oxidase subunit II [Burkholderiales bacterium]